jgi:hypothetical protein
LAQYANVLCLSDGPGRLGLVDLQLYDHEPHLDLRRLMAPDGGSNAR